MVEYTPVFPVPNMLLWKVPVAQKILQIYNPWEMIQNQFIFVFNCLLKIYAERLAFFPRHWIIFYLTHT